MWRFAGFVRGHFLKLYYACLDVFSKASSVLPDRLVADRNVNAFMECFACLLTEMLMPLFFFSPRLVMGNQELHHRPLKTFLKALYHNRDWNLGLQNKKHVNLNKHWSIILLQTLTQFHKKIYIYTTNYHF